jgi:hypothetical protein
MPRTCPRAAALLLAAACADRPAALESESSGADEGAPAGSTAPHDPPPGRDSEPPGRDDAGAKVDTSSGNGSSGEEAGGARFDLATPDVPVDAPPPFEHVDLTMVHVAVLGVMGPGQAWADIDGDGWLDLLTTGGGVASELWQNSGGTLDHSPLEPDLADVIDTTGVTFADFDNDGDPDVYLLRKGPNALLRNDDGLALVDISAAAGFHEDVHSTAATWGDYDEDGFLDVYVCTIDGAFDILYHNEGDGTFAPRTEVLRELMPDQAYGARFSDFDDDGDVDLYVVNDKHAGNRLWRNDGPGCLGWCFTEVGEDWGVATLADGMGLAVGDYDNDLDLDVSFSDIDTHWVLEMSADDPPQFEDVSAALGIAYDAHGWGTLFFDYDNDGYLDLYVADSQLPGAHTRMFQNGGGADFVDVSDACDCVDVGWNYGASYADYDLDGGVDLVVGQRGTGHVLYRNTAATGRHWLEIELAGRGPINRDAVGTRVIVETTGGMQLRRDVEIGSGVASQSSRRLHFGLGADDDLASIEITWPDGTVEYPTLPPVDALWIHGYPQ